MNKNKTVRFAAALTFSMSLYTFATGQNIPQTDSILITCRNDDWSKGWKNKSFNAKSFKAKNYKDYTVKDYSVPVSVYSETTTDGVTIQNSFPKGGRYIDPSGNNFGLAVFWTRVINETDSPVEFIISFPAAILPSPDSYFKLFLPTDTMTLDKEISYNYGAVGIKSLLDAGLDKPTLLHKIIDPKEDCLFYIGALVSHEIGLTRAELVLKGQKLFYKVNLPDFALIPCGHIILKQ